jgi:hypothetical protein
LTKKRKKIGKILETCRNGGGLQTTLIHILYPGLFQMCVKAKIRPKNLYFATSAGADPAFG